MANIPSIKLQVHGRPIQTLLEKVQGMPQATELGDERGRKRLSSPAWPVPFTMSEEGLTETHRYLDFRSEFIPIPEAATQWYDKATAAVKALAEADPQGYAEFLKFTGNATIHAPMAQCPVWREGEKDEEFMLVCAAAALQLIPDSEPWTVNAVWPVEQMVGRLFRVRLEPKK